MRPEIQENAKETLEMVYKLANHANVRSREAVPSLLVVAENGYECSCYGKAYSRILEQSPILSIRGSLTYMELVFPKNQPQDEQKFFSSPQRAACIRNRFYGTMLVSFEEYMGTDLLKSDSLLRLLDFVEQNKKNIYFVFYVSPEFNAKSQLLAKLRKYINIVEVVLEQPDVDMGYRYVKKELNHMGYILEAPVCEQIRTVILPDWVSGSGYEGYKSLDNLVSRISYEMMISPEEKDMIINTRVMESFLLKYEQEKCDAKEIPQWGFHV